MRWTLILTNSDLSTFTKNKQTEGCFYLISNLPYARSSQADYLFVLNIFPHLLNTDPLNKNNSWKLHMIWIVPYLYILKFLNFPPVELIYIKNVTRFQWTLRMEGRIFTGIFNYFILFIFLVDI